MYSLLVLVALGCGAILVAQVGSNAILGKALNDAYVPTAINMLVGLALTAVILGVVHKPLPAVASLRAAPWWSWFAGGVLGTAYLTANILLAPRLGAAALVGFIVTGQLIFAVISDNFGWLGFEHHPATLWRCAGCALMMVGVALIAKF